MLPPSRREEAGTRTYLALASAAAQALHRLPQVETVFAHRSISAREIAFGRSDIDLGLVLNGELAETGVESLLRVLERFRRLKRVCPVIGECLPLARGETGLYPVIDPFRGSLVRRAAVPLAGSPLVLPAVPPSVESACERVAFWFDLYLADALHRGNRRNLRKLAIEIWNAKAVATGAIPEPFVARRDADAAWRESDDADLRENLDGDPLRMFAVSCELAGRLHRLLLPPLPRLAHPRVFEARLTPSLAPRVVVVTPEPGGGLPSTTRRAAAFVATPEVIDLYLRYVNPFGWFELGAEAEALGVARPPLSAFRRTGLSLAAPWRVRFPGFADNAPEEAGARLTTVARGLARLGMCDSAESFDVPRDVGLQGYYRQYYTPLLAAAARIRSATSYGPADESV